VVLTDAACSKHISKDRICGPRAERTLACAGSIACALISAFGAVFMAAIAILLANDYP